MNIAHIFDFFLYCQPTHFSLANKDNLIIMTFTYKQVQPRPSNYFNIYQLYLVIF